MYATRVEEGQAKLYEVPDTLHPRDVGFVIGKDTRTVQHQCLADMETSPAQNMANYGAFKAGTDIVIPARAFWHKMTLNGIGPEIEIRERFADWMIQHGFAKEVKFDDQK